MKEERNVRKIYVHGLGQTPDSWKKIIIKLKVTDHCVCPNLAEMIQGKEATYRNLYTAFAAACNSLNEPVELCGLSLGGVLALNYAIEHPEKVKSLVLIATQYKMPKKILQFQNILFRLMPKSMFQQIGFGKSDFLQLCKTMMDLDFSNFVQKITCPTLVICGEKDTINKRASAELSGILGHAEFRIISGAGHEVNVEAPEILADVLHAFYKKIS